MADKSQSTFLSWDSRHFGFRIGRINAANLDEKTCAEALQWAGREHIDCLYFLAVADDVESSQIAEANRFQLFDRRVTLERLGMPKDELCAREQIVTIRAA